MSAERLSDPRLRAVPRTVAVRAVLLGGRLDTRSFEREGTIATTPLTVRLERGFALLFRYGVVVLVDVPQEAAQKLLADLTPRVTEPLAAAESEPATIAIQPDADEQVDPSGTIVLRDISPERLQLVASALSKSLVLGHYEARIAEIFDRIEPLADRLQKKGRTFSQARDLLRQIGYVLKTQQRMVGRVEIEEKPEILWDHPELERVYLRLEDEYELRERVLALERKLEVVSGAAQTMLDLHQAKRSLNVEYYIVVLIVFEIALALIQLLR